MNQSMSNSEISLVVVIVIILSFQFESIKSKPNKSIFVNRVGSIYCFPTENLFVFALFL